VGNDPWGKELEADRFAGHMIKLVERSAAFSDVTLNNVFVSARRWLSTAASTTHPPAQMRIQAKDTPQVRLV
jgi:hypothetical protein